MSHDALPIPKLMRAIEVSRPGGPEVLSVVNPPTPIPQPGEVLIQVEAAGINRADLMQRQGNYPPPAGASDIPGLEVAGRIVALGTDQNARRRVGDAVCALVSGGGYADYCAAPSGQCMPAPAGLSLLEAATLPEAVTTVWANLFAPRRLFRGDVLLVQGGSGGIGATAIQIAASFGAKVAATAGTDRKCAFCIDLGAAKAVPYRNHDWAAELASWSKPHGIDVILDVAGGDYFEKHLELLALDGRLVQIAFVRGSHVTLDLRAVMRKRLLITGSTLRSRPTDEKSALARAVEENLWPLYETGRLRPVLYRALPLTMAAEAHRLMESGEHTGKIVLQMH